MKGAEAGMQGGVPELRIGPVDSSLPVCGLPVGDGICTRKQGHYGPCGIAVVKSGDGGDVVVDHADR